jgi:Ran GTPase-activating protein 1
MGKDKRLDSASDAKFYVDTILQNKHAKSISLAGNTIGIEAAEVIGPALAKLDDIRYLDLHDIFVSRVVEVLRPALVHLLKGVSSKPRLRRVDLSDNAFGTRAAHDLKELLNNQAVIELILNNNGLGTDGANVIVNHILADKKLNLRRLLVGRNRLEDGGATHIARAVAQLPTLIELRMPSNSIRSAGLKAIADALHNCVAIEILDVSDNNMNREALAAMIDVLPKLTNLRVINFGDTQIGDIGCVKICAIIGEKMTHLEELYLSFNDISENGAAAIAKAIQGKKNLRYLDLDGNAISRKALAKIKDVLKEMKKSEVLAPMDENEFSDDDDDDEDDDASGSRANVVGVEIPQQANNHRIVIHHSYHLHDDDIFGPLPSLDTATSAAAPAAAAAGIDLVAEVNQLKQEVSDLRSIINKMQSEIDQLKRGSTLIPKK